MASRNSPSPDDASLGRLLEQIEDLAASASGDHLLRRMSRQLATAAGSRWSLVAEVRGMDRIRSIAIWSGEDYGEPVDYSVAGTPFEHIFSAGAVVHASGVRKAFPLDGWLESIGAEAFAAVPLFSSDGSPLGHLAVIHDGPLDGDSLMPLLRLFGLRAAPELERLGIERRLRESEERYRRLVEASPDVIYRLGFVPERRVEYVNPAAARIFGHTSAEFYSDPDLLLKLVAEPQGDEEDALAGRVFHHSNVRHWRHADGREFWTEQHNVPIYDESGRLIAEEGVSRDVTDRVAAENALAHQLDVLSALVGAMPDQLFRVSPEGNVTAIVVEPGRDNGATSSLESLIPPAAADEARRMIQAALEEKAVQTVQYTVESDDIESVYELRVSPTRDGDAIAILRDVTAVSWLTAEVEHRQAREELEHKVEVEVERNPYALSFRELTVLHLLASGKADKEIARQLGISPYTVNRHVSNILSKMGAASRTEAGVRAVRENLLV